MTHIQKTISAYLKSSNTISAFTLRCFVGMIETGEATLEDFETVGGVDVRNLLEGAL